MYTLDDLGQWAKHTLIYDYPVKLQVMTGLYSKSVTFIVVNEETGKSFDYGNVFDALGKLNSELSDWLE